MTDMADQAQESVATAEGPGDGSPGLHFQIPSEFHEIPLAIGNDESAHERQLEQFAQGYWGGRDDLAPLRELTKTLYAVTTQDLVAGGTVYSAFGIYPMGGDLNGSQPPERISRATLTISVREMENPDPYFTAAGIAETLEKAPDTEGSEVQPVSLRAGPAVVRIVGSRMVWELQEGDLERFSVRIEVWLPFPHDDKVLLLCMSTPDVEDLLHYQGILADIANSVRFGEDSPTNQQVTPSSSGASPFSSY
ncbi:hypothetical protein ACPCIY_26145 [Streptomyces thermodiastaticus]